MTFLQYWHEFRGKNGTLGPTEMELCFYQWLFENSKISLVERNTEFDRIYEQYDY